MGCGEDEGRRVNQTATFRAALRLLVRILIRTSAMTTLVLGSPVKIKINLIGLGIELIK